MNPEANMIRPDSHQPAGDQPATPPQAPETEAPQTPSPTASHQPAVANPPAPQPFIPTDVPPDQIASMPSSPETREHPPVKRVLLALAVLLTVGGAAYVFAWYIPNQPENVWRTGLERTGEALEDMALKAVRPANQDVSKNLELTGSLAYKGPDTTITGGLRGKYDTRQSDSGLNLKIDAPGSANLDFSLDVLTDLAEGNRLPDVYVKVSGLTRLGLAAWVPEAQQIDGKWVAASSGFWESYLPDEVKEDALKEAPAAEEISDLVQIVTSVTRDYIFTDDDDKAVLARREYLGEKTLNNGIKAKHYKVGVNAANAVSYCEALLSSVLGHPATSKLISVEQELIDKEKAKVPETCGDYFDGEDIKDASFDMWIDSKYKLIHKIRISDDDKPGNYFELGQNYNGGDEIPIFVRYHSDEQAQDETLTLRINNQARSAKLEFSMEQTGDQGFTITADLEAKPHEDDVVIDKPAEPVPLEDFLETIGLPSDQPAIPAPQPLLEI